MIGGSLPYRYGRALANLAQDEAELARIKQELDGLVAVLRQMPKLKNYIADIIVPQRERLHMLTQALDTLKASELFRRFGLFLVRKERFGQIEAIARAYTELCDEIGNVIRATVVSATPLEPKQGAQIEQLLADKTGKKVALEYATDPALIGGLRIRLGSREFDGSVRGDLNRVQEEMLK